MSLTSYELDIIKRILLNIQYCYVRVDGAIEIDIEQEFNKLNQLSCSENEVIELMRNSPNVCFLDIINDIWKRKEALKG